MSDNSELEATKPEGVLDTEAVTKALENADKSEMRKVNMACRRTAHLDGRPGSSSGDGDLADAKDCPSKSAYIMNDVMEGSRKGNMMYRCVDCGYTWTVSTGSTFRY